MTRAKSTTNGTRSKSTERTLKVTSDGWTYVWAFEVCWSRGRDGIISSDDPMNN